jgi:hypothetical protein
VENRYTQVDKIYDGEKGIVRFIESVGLERAMFPSPEAYEGVFEGLFRLSGIAIDVVDIFLDFLKYVLGFMTSYGQLTVEEN